MAKKAKKAKKTAKAAAKKVAKKTSKKKKYSYPLLRDCRQRVAKRTCPKDLKCPLQPFGNAARQHKTGPLCS